MRQRGFILLTLISVCALLSCAAPAAQGQKTSALPEPPPATDAASDADFSGGRLSLPLSREPDWAPLCENGTYRRRVIVSLFSQVDRFIWGHWRAEAGGVVMRDDLLCFTPRWSDEQIIHCAKIEADGGRAYDSDYIVDHFVPFDTSGSPSFCERDVPPEVNAPPQTLHGAARVGDIAKIDAYLDAGADVRGREVVRHGFLSGAELPVLYTAVNEGQLGVIRHLIERGAIKGPEDCPAEFPGLYGFPTDSGGHVPLEALMAIYDSGLCEIDQRGKNGGTALRHAAALEDGIGIKLAQQLLKRGADINIADDSGVTPIMAAAAGGEGSFFELLEVLSPTQQPDLHAVDARGHSALWHAIVARPESPAVVEALLERGVNPLASDKQGRSILYAAVFVGQQEVAMKLLEAGADAMIVDAMGRGLVDLLELQAEAGEGDIDSIEVLREHGARPQRDNSLHLAIRDADAPDVEALLEDGAKLHETRPIRFTPGFEEAPHDLSPTAFAASLAAEDTLALLIARGGIASSDDCPNAHPDIFDEEWWSINFELSSLLYASPHCNINALTPAGEPPLMMLLRSYKEPYSNREEAEALIRRFEDAGADLKLTDRKNRTLFSSVAAIRCGTDEGRDDGRADKKLCAALFQTLLDRGLDINARDDQGQTPLFAAMYAGDLQAMTQLIQMGARVDVIDKEGHSVSDRALETKHPPEFVEAVQALVPSDELQMIPPNTRHKK